MKETCSSRRTRGAKAPCIWKEGVDAPLDSWRLDDCSTAAESTPLLDAALCEEKITLNF
jgi:hypothetical protein